jgi:nucleotide-binding universal stress UspA family protein
MIEIPRILCPIDFSEFSGRALAHAIAIAGWYDSSITLLHVWPFAPAVAYPPGSGAFPPPPALTTDGRQTLVADLQRLADEAGATGPVECEVVEGPAAPEILRRAAALPADLLVLGTHGRSGFERLMLGSVTEKVVRRAACPVLTVPRRAAGPAADGPVRFKRIACAIDFSDCSMHALRYAMSLAQEADARLTVVHVIERPVHGPPDPSGVSRPGPRSLEEYLALMEQEARARLDDVVPQEVRAYCTVETAVPSGTPYREILRVVEAQQADVLVVGTHGRGALDRMLFGSTTQHLVRQSPCPVLTLRHA